MIAHQHKQFAYVFLLQILRHIMLHKTDFFLFLVFSQMNLFEACTLNPVTCDGPSEK